MTNVVTLEYHVAMKAVREHAYKNYGNGEGWNFIADDIRPHEMLEDLMNEGIDNAKEAIDYYNIQAWRRSKIQHAINTIVQTHAF